MSEQMVLGRFGDLERRILRRFWGDELTGHLFAGGHFEPCVDVFETAEGMVVKMEIPGMKKKDISVEFERGILIITGRRCDKTNVPKRTYHQMEIDYGAFERGLKIDMPVREDAITALYRDGFLEVHLPRRRSTRKNSASGA